MFKTPSPRRKIAYYIDDNTVDFASRMPGPVVSYNVLHCLKDALEREGKGVKQRISAKARNFF